MRLAVFCVIAAGVALAGASVIVATPVNPTSRDVEVPAVQLSADTSQDMDQEFHNLLQLLGPDADDLVRGAVDFPEPANLDDADLDGINPESLMPNLGDDLGDFTLSPKQWAEIFQQSG
jgi:hypothetical protein